MERTLQRKHNFDLKSADTTKHEVQNSSLFFTIIGLPAESANPVKILVNNAEVYSSGNSNGDVSANFQVPAQGTVDVTLKIPVMEFENTKKFTISEGQYIKFEAGKSGLSILQQRKPF